jgi:hypothetical protein
VRQGSLIWNLVKALELRRKIVRGFAAGRLALEAIDA